MTLSTDHPKLAPTPGRTEPRPRSGPPSHAAGDPPAPALRYRPIWNVQQKMMNLHLCEPAAPMAGHDPAAAGRADRHLLAQVLRDMQGGMEPAGPERGAASVCLPVQHTTLTDPAARAAFLAACDSVPDGLRELLVWEIVGLPEDAGERSLFSMVSTLRPHGRAVFLRSRLDRAEFGIPAAVGVHSVGPDLAEAGAPESDAVRQLERFAECAHGAGLRCHAHGLATSSVTLAAFSCGFDYLAGTAICELRATPWQVRPFDAENLFLGRHLPGG